MARSAVIIPSRWGSTRFPGKPLARIAGKTLIERVWERAKSSSADEVWVATDDERIEAKAREIGANVVMTSPELRTGTDRVAAALESIGTGPEIDVVINVQGDEPLIEPSLIDRLIDELRSSGADLISLCCPIESEEERQSPDVVKVVTTLDGHALYFSRSPIPSGDHPAQRHIGVYGFTRRALAAFPSLETTPLERSEKLEQLRLLENGFRMKILRTSKPHSGVDRPEDIPEIERELAAE